MTTKNQGTLVIAPIRPYNDDSTFPVAHNDEIKGHAGSVVDTVALAALPAHILEEGMLIYVQDEHRFFVYATLSGTWIANTEEVVDTISGSYASISSGTFDTISAGYATITNAAIETLSNSTTTVSLGTTTLSTTDQTLVGGINEVKGEVTSLSGAVAQNSRARKRFLSGN